MRTSWMPWAILAALVARWSQNLSESLWLDETLTAFVLRYGVDHPSLDAAPGVRSSVYYPLLDAWEAVFGESEVALRVPSLLFSLGALFLLWRITRRMIGPEAGAHAAWIAVFLCFVTRDFALRATEARPYGLALLLTAGAMWFLLRFLDRRAAWGNAVAFCACGGLLAWTQPMLTPILAVCFGYAAVRGVRWTSLLWIALALAMACAPVLADALTWGGARHVFARSPTWREAAMGLQLPVVGILAPAAWLAGRVFRFHGTPGGGGLAMAWWLWQPLLLGAISFGLNDGSVFVRRYFITATLGAAIMAAWCVVRYVPKERLRVAAYGIGAAILIVNFVRPAPSHRSPNREVAALVSQLGGKNALILRPSGFIEAQPPVWSPEYRLPGFLYAPLDRYPVEGELLLLPNREAREQPVDLVAARLGARPVIVVGGSASAGFWEDWLASQPRLAGWQHTRRHVGDLIVAKFAPP